MPLDLSSLPTAVVGDRGLADRLARCGVTVVDSAEAARVVVVAGAPGARAEAASEAVAHGAHVFLTWPPGVSAAELDAVGARAEEAGVEVGVGRPPAAAALLAERPAGWSARLVSLSLGAAPGGRLLAACWPALLAGAADVCAGLAASGDVAHVEAEAERDGAGLRAVLFSLRFRNGALAQAAVRSLPPESEDEVALYASRPGSRVEARSLGGPLHTEGVALAPSAPDAGTLGALPFVRAVAAGRSPAYGLSDALGTLRLVERILERLR